MMTAAQTDMDLRLLLQGFASMPPSVDVADIATHSAEVVPGGLFLACAGSNGHGLRFLGDALRHGARAVAWEPAATEPAPVLPADVCAVPVPGLGRRLGDIANRFFANPSAGMSVTGITGTNGKTTVAWLLAQSLTRLGRRAGYMGTLGYGLGGELRSGDLTTPACVTVHRRLRELADGLARHVAIEVSSHALEQGRVDGVAFHVVAFTNLSRDHLDYHRDMASYGRAKERLFLDSGAPCAVINTGDEFGRGLAAKLPGSARLITVATTGTPADLQARRLAGDACGQRIEFVFAGQRAQFTTPLAGDFNVENLAVTAGILIAEGFGLEATAAALAACTAPPGRMEVVAGPAGPRVVVDFAHTPAALARVLAALRVPGPGRVWCVFGCGGERDPGKREEMGAVARRLADQVVVTDDNPRHEDPEAIVAAVLRGTGRDAAVTVIRDRAAAIRHAIRSAAASDVVLIAGKGHESGQIVGHETRPFSDRAVASAVLAELA
jgi:UDP-N-acetylmuramoyl-L-alanyl-D-glutamate--2,6-diaminopimelate ligase